MSILHQLVKDADAASVEMSFHELADIFPMMTDEELSALTADMKEHGQRDPIVTWQGKILDGRNRYRACVSLSITPKTVEWNGVGSAQAFVVSHNLHRRHLNEGQRAMIAARLAQLKDGVRKDFQKKGGEISPPSMSAQEAANLLNVNRSTVIFAKKILAEGTPKEVKAAEEGKVAVSTLAKKIRDKVPPEERIKKQSLSEAGKNPERISAVRANGRLWQFLRDALQNITSLPRPADMVPVARMFDRAKLTDAKLLITIQWLMEFSDAWTSPDAEGNSGGKDKPARKAKEVDASQGATGGAT